MKDAYDARPGDRRTAALAVPLVAVLALLVGCDDGREAAARGTPVDRPLPEVTLERVGGDSARLGEVLGRRLTADNFWTTWCEPCEEEMPHLVALHDAWSDGGVRVVGITVRSHDRDAIRGWIDRFGVEHPTLVGRSLTWMSRAFGQSPGVPRTLVVDSRSRRIRHVWSGARSRAELERGVLRYWREEWGAPPRRATGADSSRAHSSLVVAGSGR